MGLWDLGWPHALYDDVSILIGVCVAFGCSNVPPHVGIDIVLDNAVTVEVDSADIALGVGVSLFRWYAALFKCFFIASLNFYILAAHQP